MAWFDGDGIVEVGDIDTLNQNVRAVRVNTVGIQGRKTSVPLPLAATVTNACALDFDAEGLGEDF